MDNSKTYKELINKLAKDNQLRGITGEESKELKKVLLQAYLDVLNVCNKYELSLFLVGGSLLGAVRHQGFIPWDDDMDVAMSRHDVNCFKTIFSKELGDKYILNAPNHSDNPMGRFPKILIKNTKLVELGMCSDDDNSNIKIDLFLIESIPANILLRAIHGAVCSGFMYIASNVEFFEKRALLKSFMCSSKEGQTTYRKKVLLGSLFSIVGSTRWFNIVDRACQYRRETSLVGIPTGRKHYFGEIRKKETFFPPGELPFEGEMAIVPNNWDDYLSNLYGNYMNVPNVEDREQHLIYAISFNDR